MKITLDILAKYCEYSARTALFSNYSEYLAISQHEETNNDRISTHKHTSVLKNLKQK